MPNRVVKPKNYKPVGRPETVKLSKKEETRRRLFMMHSKARENAANVVDVQQDTVQNIPNIDQRPDNVEAEQLFEISYDSVDMQATIKKKQEEWAAEQEAIFKNKLQEELTKQQEQMAKLLHEQVEQKLQERLQQELAKQQDVMKRQEENMKQLYEKKQEELKQEQAKLLQTTTAAAQQINKLYAINGEYNITRRRKGILY